MTKFTLDEDTIINCIALVKKKVDELKWNSDNEVELFVAKKSIGTIKLTEGSPVVTTEKEATKIFEEVLEFYKKKQKDIVTDEEFSKSIFKKFTDKTQLNGLDKNKEIFKSVEKELKSVGIVNILPRGDFTLAKSFCNKITLAIEPYPTEEQENSPSGMRTRLATFLFKNYETLFEDSKEIPIRDIFYFKKMNDDETRIEIKIKETIIGYYYPERNFVQLFFNPFMLKPILSIQETPYTIFAEIFKSIKAVSLKQVDISGIQEKIIITKFMSRTKTSLENSERQLRDYNQRIEQMQRDLMGYYGNAEETRASIGFLQTLIATKGKGILEELETTKKLPFITSVEFQDDSIVIKMEPTTIKLPNFVREEHSTNYGTRVAYIGSLTYRISPNDIRVDGDAPIVYRGGGTNPHPHVSGSGGQPCFGSGAGRNKIFEMLAQNKISELAKLLWFWSKVFVNEGAYIHYSTFMDDRLTQGYPVWDEKGNRIYANDPERLKTKEQPQTLTLASNYKENIKKFETFKMK